VKVTKTALAPYVVKRTGEEQWTIDSIAGLGIEAAVEHCSYLDDLRGFDWDFDTCGQAKDGLEALKIGESLTVTYPDDDDD
jgi:hypothetical protein